MVLEQVAQQGAILEPELPPVGHPERHADRTAHLVAAATVGVVLLAVFRQVTHVKVHVSAVRTAVDPDFGLRRADTLHAAGHLCWGQDRLDRVVRAVLPAGAFVPATLVTLVVVFAHQARVPEALDGGPVAAIALDV